MISYLIKHNHDFDGIFSLILTRLYIWIKALFTNFLYCTTNLLLSIDGLIKWTKCKKPLTNIDGSSIGKLGPAGIEGILHCHKWMAMSNFFFFYFIRGQILQ